jgi:hypothetical protein
MASSASQRRAALATTTSSTGWTSVGEPLMTCKTSAVAVCCSSASSRSRCARASFSSKVCIGVLRHRGRPLSPFRRLPLHGGGRLLTRLVEVRLKAYARLGDGSMVLGGHMHGRYDQLLRCTPNFHNGSKARITAPQHCCPLYPDHLTLGARGGISRLCHHRT